MTVSNPAKNTSVCTSVSMFQIITLWSICLTGVLYYENTKEWSSMSEPNQFSPGEQKVIDQLLQAKSNKQIALALDITESTVESHLTKIYAKLGVGSRVVAILRLRELGKTPKPAEEDKSGE